MSPLGMAIMDAVKNGERLKLSPDQRTEVRAAIVELLRDLDTDETAIRALADSVDAEIKSLDPSASLESYTRELREAAAFPASML